MTNDKLPETTERIKADAEAYADAEHEYTREIEKAAYIAGAEAENERAQPVIDALEQFIARHEGGLLPDRFIYEKGVKALEQWKDGKPTDPCPNCGKDLSRDRNLCCRECGKEVERQPQETTIFNLSTDEKKILLAKKIENRMKETGLQRQEFADLMGVQRSVITRWLSGSHNFETFTLFEIERQLNINLFKL